MASEIDYATYSEVPAFYLDKMTVSKLPRNSKQFWLDAGSFVVDKYAKLFVRSDAEVVEYLHPLLAHPVRINRTIAGELKVDLTLAGTFTFAWADERHAPMECVKLIVVDKNVVFSK